MSYSTYITDALKHYINKMASIPDFEKLSAVELKKMEEICFKNRVLAMVGSVLDECGQKCKLAIEGAKANATNEFGYYMRMREYKGILVKLIENVEFALVKGVHIGNLIFKNPFDRPSSDLDILVKYEQVPVVEKILQSSGYKQAYVTTNGLKDYSRKTKMFYALNAHSLAPFRKIKNNVLYEIDVNFNSRLDDKKSISASEFLKDRTNMNLFGIDVPVLNDTYALLYLSLHHYRESVSLYHIFCGQDFDFLKACDIYYFFSKIKLDEKKVQDFILKYDVRTELCKIFDDVKSVFGDGDMMPLELKCDSKQRENGGIEWPIGLPERLEYDNRFEMIKDQLNKQQLTSLSANKLFLK